MSLLTVVAAGLAGFLGRPWIEQWLFVQAGAARFGDLLMYGHCASESGVMYLDDGRFLAGLRLEPPDATAVGTSELAAIRRSLQKSVSTLGGCTAQVDLFRRPVEVEEGADDFPSPGLGWMAKERRRRQGQRTIYRSEVVLSITSPRKIQEGTWASWFSGNQGTSVSEAELEAFDATVSTFAGGLPRELGVQRMGPGAMLTYLRFCATGLHAEVGPQEVVAPRLGSIVADTDLVTVGERTRGGMHMAVVSVTHVPREVRSDPLAFLHECDFDVRSACSFEVWPPAVAGKRLQEMLELRVGALRGMRSKIAMALANSSRDTDSETADRLYQNQGSVREGEEVNQAQAALTEGSDYFGRLRWTFVVNARSAQQLQERVRTVVGGIQRLRCTAVVEGHGFMPVLHSAMPGHSGASPRCATFSGSGFSEIFPLLVPWLGEETVGSQFFPENQPAALVARVRPAHDMSAAGTPFFFNPYVGDLGHTMVVGKTGSGKSVLLSVLASYFLGYPNSRVCFLDVGGSARMFAAISGGHYFPLSLDGAEGCSLDVMASLAEGDAGLAGILEWLVMVLRLREVEVTPREERLLTEKLRDLQPVTELHTLRALVDTLQGELRDGLMPYAKGGLYGSLFDQNAQRLVHRVNVFELERLLEREDAVAIPAALLIIQRIRRGLDRGVPTLLVIDEAVRLLGHPVLRRWLILFLREARKMNMAVVLGTQSVGDLVSAELGPVVRESMATQIHVPNRMAESPDQDAGYEALGLSRKARQAIAEGRPKGQYVFAQDAQARLIDLDLSPLELEFLSGQGGAADRWNSAVELRGPEAWRTLLGADSR